MGQIISRYNQERSGSKSPVALEMRTWFNPNQITRWFFLPGIIGLLSFSQVFLLSGLSVAREREEGTFEQILVAPISEPIILIGKAVPPMIVGIIQCTILLLSVFSGSRCLLQGPFLIFMPRFSSMSSVLPGLGSAFPPFQRICSRYSFTSLS